MTTPIRTLADLLKEIKELLPHNTLMGRSDDLPQDFKEGFVIEIGDLSKVEDQSGLCCTNYDHVFFIDYRAQLHRDDWLIRTAEKQAELVALLQDLHPRLRFQNFDDPTVESADKSYVGSRSTWVFNYDL